MVSSTDRHPYRAALGWDELVRSVVDVGHLLRFRASTVQRPGRARAVIAAVLLTTLAIAVAPAFASGAGGEDGARDLLILLPTALVGFVLLAGVSAAASGGGRELIAREPGAVHPISPATDHFGALLLAPVNIAWLLQTWTLLGVTAYGVGAAHLVTAQVVVVLWVAAATALAQLLAWLLEGVRRVPHGIVGIRLLNVVVLGTALGLQLFDRLLTVLDRLPTGVVVVTMLDGFSWRWFLSVLVLAAALLLLVVAGAIPATIAAHRTPRDELRAETGRYQARRTAATELGALVRVDRASVWRAVPMRRGLLVLAVGPGVVAILGDLPWASMTVLPGLVASGGALLYGVNAWCLDGRGALWRESLPVEPRLVFDARALVLGEFLLAASLLTVAVAGVRAGLPSATELTALVCALLVVVVQVVAAALRWSAARPFAVDLRSSRATPAPPAVMVGYSARLALSTTVTGLVFTTAGRADVWELPIAVALPMLAWSGWRLTRTRRAWVDAPARARVVTVVAVA